MSKLIMSVLVMVGVFGFIASSVYAQTATPSASPTASPSPTPAATSPSGAPNTGFGR